MAVEAWMVHISEVIGFTDHGGGWRRGPTGHRFVGAATRRSPVLLRLRTSRSGRIVSNEVEHFHRQSVIVAGGRTLHALDRGCFRSGSDISDQGVEQVVGLYVLSAVLPKKSF